MATTDEIIVRLNGVSKAFGKTVAVHPLDLTIRRGEFLAILGPSGCGKTTLLNIIAGFLYPDSGSVEIGGKDVTRLPPDRRPTNMVFQGYGLFPHMTVRQNIAYGLHIRKAPKQEIKERVREIIDLVHLEDLEERSVGQLSGGQAQRVALARALIMRPDVLLLDEPLAALDLKLRKAMQTELRRIHSSIGGTFVFVTHDQHEAMGLANQIAVMSAGRIVQQGTAENIYAAPQSRFVSTFIGEANVLRGRRSSGRITLALGGGFEDAGADEDVVVMLRPEAANLAPADAVLPDDALRLAGRLEDAVFLGTYMKYTVTVDDEIFAVHSADTGLRERVAVGDAVQMSWAHSEHMILPDT
jgi:spermidine/putrescine transport system ATP-binding protein